MPSPVTQCPSTHRSVVYHKEDVAGRTVCREANAARCQVVEEALRIERIGVLLGGASREVHVGHVRIVIQDLLQFLRCPLGVSVQSVGQTHMYIVSSAHPVESNHMYAASHDTPSTLRPSLTFHHPSAR